MGKKNGQGRNMEQYRIYKKEHTPAGAVSEDVKHFHPCPVKGLFISGEERHWKTALSRLYFWAITKGKLEIYYILSEAGRVAHTSYVVPACYKFPFMQKGDYEIGPCQTEENSRGKGLYVKTLNRITSEQAYEKAVFYMLVSEDNIPSVRGIEKAGFLPDGHAVRTGKLKTYVKVVPQK